MLKMMSGLFSPGSKMKKVHRKWGTYEVLYSADTYRVKRLVIDPGAALSNQYHLHRKENWKVVKGKVKLKLINPEIDTSPYVINLEEGASWTIDKRTWHEASNPTSEPAEVIEIWTGNQLSEEDIVRQER